ncbi:DUF1697 domain-containing protein [Agrococcus sp. ARC_14]|uniref:DUF1697 domain-containing protein n=1 Tax=Agrococcus sp. ARC_14 TaxID=2919927 RepID=UPI001F06D2DC|nr:DUF1697 domain-containing protein [Agrococcus sp. ARC_14]MCH1882993.1 DUF1697 domain-containing protein [Agrococcus sp. ARC_14]
MRVALLLRGVNVGGVTVRSADLRALLAEAGLGDVATVLASGNAVVTATDASAAAQAAEAALEARYGRRIRVLGIAIDALAAIVADYPHAEDDEHTPYVVFELERGLAAELAELEPGDGETIATGDAVVHWSNPKGTTLTSPFAKALERTAKDRVTTRNLRTLRKVLAAS